MKEEKLFFLQKVFLFESFHWKLSNSLFKNAPSGKKNFAHCDGRLGASRPLFSPAGSVGVQRLPLANNTPSPKGLSPFGIRMFAGKQTANEKCYPRVLLFIFVLGRLLPEIL